MRPSFRRLVTASLFWWVFFAWPMLPAGFPSARLAEVLSAAIAYAQDEGGVVSVTDFEIAPLYRAARLTWRARVSEDAAVTFEIYRSMTTPEGPYTLVASIQSEPGKKNYRYVDKELPVEENYYYKLDIPAAEQSFGPLQVRPPFSLPTT